MRPARGFQADSREAQRAKGAQAALTCVVVGSILGSQSGDGHDRHAIG